MSPAALSALSALAGSAIGAFATFGTTWLTQTQVNRTQRWQQESTRRERIYGEFVDMAAQLHAHALSHEFEPDRLVPLYALISRMRLFAPLTAVQSANTVLETIVIAYRAPNYDFDLAGDAARDKLDLLRQFTQICRDDLVH